MTPKFSRPDADPELAATRMNYVIQKALAYAISQIQTLPPYRQEHSDASDMMFVLHKFTSKDFHEVLAWGVLGYTGRLPNLEAMPPRATDQAAHTGAEAQAWFNSLPKPPWAKSAMANHTKSPSKPAKVKRAK